MALLVANQFNQSTDDGQKYGTQGKRRIVSIKTQLKIMDIDPLLNHLYARMSATQDDTPAGVRSRRTLQAALQKWGRAFAHISRKRREAVINVTDPTVDST